MRRNYSEIKMVAKYFKYLRMSNLGPPDKSGKEWYFKPRKNLQTKLNLAAFKGG